MQNSGKGEHPAGAENILPQKGECRSEDKAPCKQAKNAEYKVGQSASASQSGGGDYRTGYGHKTQIAVNRMIQRAVLEVLEEDGLRYQSFVSLQQNQSGETTALITDTVLINRLQGELLEKILQTLQQYRELKLELPLGSLTGIQFLAGRGPLVALQLRPVGLVKTKIINQFDEAGINQTRHRIQLQVTVDMLSLLPGYRISSQAQCNVILAETIIVGCLYRGVWRH